MCPGLVQAGHKTPVPEHSPEYLGHIVGNISVIFLEHWCAVRVVSLVRKVAQTNQSGLNLRTRLAVTAPASPALALRTAVQTFTSFSFLSFSHRPSQADQK